MRHPAALLLVLACVGIAGCCSSAGYVKQGYDFSGVRRVAVADVKGATRQEGVRDFIADLYAGELTKLGYDVVERRQLKAVLTEQEFQDLDLTSSEGAAQVGRLENVDALLMVNVAEFSDEGTAMTAKLLDVESADVLWIASGTAKTGRVPLAIVGGAIGGLFGWIIPTRHEDKPAVAVAGAAAGVAAALAISPEKEDALRRAVSRTMRPFPSRLDAF